MSLIKWIPCECELTEVQPNSFWLSLLSSSSTLCLSGGKGGCHSHNSDCTWLISEIFFFMNTNTNTEGNSINECMTSETHWHTDILFNIEDVQKSRILDVAEFRVLFRYNLGSDCVGVYVIFFVGKTVVVFFWARGRSLTCGVRTNSSCWTLLASSSHSSDWSASSCFLFILWLTSCLTTRFW